MKFTWIVGEIVHNHLGYGKPFPVNQSGVYIEIEILNLEFSSTEDDFAAFTLISRRMIKVV